MYTLRLAPDFFLDMVLDRFKIKDWLSLSTDTQHLPTRAYRDQDQKVQIIESCLFFIVSILSTRYGSSCERFFINSLKTVSFFSVFIFACWFYNWKHSKYLNRFYYFILWNFHFCDFVIVSLTDYGCLIKPFFIEIPNFWAWADKLWGIYQHPFGYCESFIYVFH